MSIRGRCAHCNRIFPLALTDITVSTCVNDGDRRILYRCPDCAAVQTRHARDSHVVDVLINGGALLAFWRYPLELTEPHAGPTFTPDDMLDFHELLESDDWFDTLASTS